LDAQIFLAPVIEGMNVVGNGEGRDEEVLKSANNIAGCHVLRRIIVPIYQENTALVSSLWLPSVVQGSEIPRIVCGQGVTLPGRIVEVVCVT
jgi:hypothetical protein